jgi:hypothetical protein
VRRLIQVLTLLVMILAGSWPAAYLDGAPEPGSCCAGMAAGQPCPCRMPGRSSGPTAPCGQSQPAPLAILVAPLAGIQAQRTARPEPQPAPLAIRLLGLRADADPAAGGPSRLARPGPGWARQRADEPPGRRQARLSVFRI